MQHFQVVMQPPLYSSENNFTPKYKNDEHNRTKWKLGRTKG